MGVDLRAGKSFKFSGSDDPKFIELSLFWHMNSKPFGALDELSSRISVEAELQAVLNRPVKTTKELCQSSAEMWATTPAPDLAFRFVYLLARVFGCQDAPVDEQSEGEPKPQLDMELLIEQIKQFLAKEYDKVAAIAAEGNYNRW